MKPFIRSLAAFAAFGIFASGFAWNDTGHMVIAALAEDRLSPKAFNECERLLKVGGTEKAGGFVAGACWADDTAAADNRKWHFISQPLRADGKTPVGKVDEQNAVWAINHFTDVLKDKSKPDAERADALRYLIHLVGDLHQPLHAATMESEDHPEGDKNGADFTIKTGDLFTSMASPPTDLHTLWDMGCGLFPQDLVSRPLNPELKARIHILAVDLGAKFTDRQLSEQVKDLDPNNWARESLLTAKNVVYTVRTGGEVDLAYATIGRTIAGQRACLAGYRLAALLNKILG